MRTITRHKLVGTGDRLWERQSTGDSRSIIEWRFCSFKSFWLINCKCCLFLVNFDFARSRRVFTSFNFSRSRFRSSRIREISMGKIVTTLDRHIVRSCCSCLVSNALKHDGHWWVSFKYFRMQFLPNRWPHWVETSWCRFWFVHIQAHSEQTNNSFSEMFSKMLFSTSLVMVGVDGLFVIVVPFSLSIAQRNEKGTWKNFSFAKRASFQSAWLLENRAFVCFNKRERERKRVFNDDALNCISARRDNTPWPWCSAHRYIRLVSFPGENGVIEIDSSLTWIDWVISLWWQDRGISQIIFTPRWEQSVPEVQECC